MRSHLLALLMAPLLVAGVLGACGKRYVDSVRYRNQPIVWRVNDRNPVPRQPRVHVYYRSLYYLDIFFTHALPRAMEYRLPRRAANANALGEVPDSTWFTNRIGVKDLSPEEVRRGPAAADGPDQHKPWKVIRGKSTGDAVGFWIADSRGYEYLVKLDDIEAPEMQSATAAIVQRILWACAYSTPAASVVTFRRSDLQLSPNATIKDDLGRERRMTQDDLDRELLLGYVGPGGVYRGLASRRLDGVPLGPIPATGVREDDPNDTIAHERRRELRGLYAIYAWLNQADNQKDNTLDVWVTDPISGKRYVRHYLLDFGKAFGALTVTGHRRQWVGFYHYLDSRLIVGSLLGFGLWKRPFEDVIDSGLRGVGAYEIEGYHPGRWTGASVYWPMEVKDRFDAFWASKILIRFTRDQLAAAVAAGKLTDPRASQYLLHTLIARQRRTARFWFGQVAPLDRFEIRDRALCFEDLALRYELEPDNVTRIRAWAYDYGGKATGWSWQGRPGRGGRTCTTPIDTGKLGHRGYAIVRLDTHRGSETLPPTLVHIASGPDGRARVIGVRRL